MQLPLDAETKSLIEEYGFDLELFQRLRAQLLRGDVNIGANRVNGKVEAPAASDVVPLEVDPGPKRDALYERGMAALRAGQVGCIVLAGGMATRFGGVVKAEVEALPGYSFLTLKLRDIRHVAERAGKPVPIYVMSSFATHKVLAELARREQSDAAPIEVFPQFISLRLTPEGELFRETDGSSPYAPGHGDLSFALRRSKRLQNFLQRGGRMLTMSNVDNLAATLDPVVLGHHLQAAKAMTIEVGRRTPGELGGLPLRVDGKLQIVEDFRLPEGFAVDSVPQFNTNTFVFDALALDRDFDLQWFMVKKKVDGREAIQFERLVGQLSAFLPCVCLEVPRSGLNGRFQPAKDPEELARRQPEIEQIMQARGVI